MKFHITTIIILFNLNNLFSQDFTGKRILTGNLYLQIQNNKIDYDNNLFPVQYDVSTRNNNVGFSFLSGRIKQNNTYTAYGVNFSVQGSGNNDSRDLNNYFLGPELQFGKFVKVFDQFYFAPNTRLSSTYGWSNIVDGSVNSISFRATIAPLSFVYRLNEKLLFNISMGSFGVGYSRTIAKSDSFKTEIV